MKTEPRIGRPPKVGTMQVHLRLSEKLVTALDRWLKRKKRTKLGDRGQELSDMIEEGMRERGIKW